MLPDDIWNWIASTAEVVFPYPAICPSNVNGFEAIILTLDVKCLTKVVELGLNKFKEPDVPSSALLFCPIVKGWNPVPCAKSSPALYDNSPPLPSS